LAEMLRAAMALAAATNDKTDLNIWFSSML
jgi:hypothetical protein